MRPQSIVKFDQFYLAVMVIGIVGIGLNYQMSVAQFDADPALSQLGFSATAFLLGIYAFSMSIMLLLWYFISRRASNVARWILTVLTAFGLITMPFSLFVLPWPSLIVAVVSAGLQIAMLWFLFRPDAAAWFENGRQIIDPDIFE